MSHVSAGDFSAAVTQLAAVPVDRLGPVGGGPVPPGADVVVARRLVRECSVEQLKQLLRHKRPAVRAHAAREIIRGRPTEVALVRPLLSDQAKITVASMADVPPIRDERMTVAQLVKRELTLAGLNAAVR